jgi:2,3-dihydroxybenzoate decarboxylase
MMELGIDRIMFSVDWPFVANPPAMEWMRTLQISDADKQKIFGGNAKKLLKL